jgi:dUTP pyrophosphatase
MKVKIKLLHPTARIPEYKTDGAAAADVCAAIDSPITIEPVAFALVPAGFAIDAEGGEIGNNFAILLFARSGLATKHGIALANGVGVIDSDYRGEVKVSLVNLSANPYTITPGERIAQMMITPVLHADFELADELSSTERGDGGFGHTG